MSQRIGRRSLPKNRYLQSDAELAVQRVSKYSLWFSRTWRFENPSGGRKPTTINWEKKPEVWNEPRYQKLVQLGRRFIDALRSLPAAPADASVSAVGAHTVYLLIWMFENGLDSLSDLTPPVVDIFVEDLVADKIGEWEVLDDVEDDPDFEVPPFERGPIGRETLSDYLDVLTRMHALRPHFASLPDMLLPEHPFRGAAAEEIAAKFARSRSGSIPAVPLEVFNPTVEKCLDWIDNQAEDIFRLQDVFLQARKRTSHYKGYSYCRYTNKNLLEFSFNNGKPAELPWRQPILPIAKCTRWHSDLQQYVTSDRTPGQQYKDLLVDLRDASTSAVQAGTGMRVGELCGLEAYPRRANGMPKCIDIRSSSTGLLEVFYITGFRYKRRGRKTVPIPAEWVAGIRPSGSTWLPYPIRAILTLDRLFAPWRDMMHSKALIIPLGSGNGHVPRQVLASSKILTDEIAKGQDRFCRTHVAVPVEFRDWRLSTHQWRKRFAQDVVRYDPSLLRPVADQLDHLSVLVTEGAYVGSDPTLRRLIDEAAINSAAQVMYDVIYGGATPAHKPTLETAKLYAKVEETFSHLPEGERRAKLGELMREDGVRLWDAKYGSCLFRSECAKCQYLWRGDFDLSAIGPANAVRSPEVCCTCANLYIDKRHEKYWSDTLDESTRMAMLADAASDLITVAFCKRRIELARFILQRIKREVRL